MTTELSIVASTFVGQELQAFYVRAVPASCRGGLFGVVILWRHRRFGFDSLSIGPVQSHSFLCQCGVAIRQRSQAAPCTAILSCVNAAWPFVSGVKRLLAQSFFLVGMRWRAGMALLLTSLCCVSSVRLSFSLLREGLRVAAGRPSCRCAKAFVLLCKFAFVAVARAFGYCEKLALLR